MARDNNELKLVRSLVRQRIKNASPVAIGGLLTDILLLAADKRMSDEVEIALLKEVRGKIDDRLTALEANGDQ